MMNLNLHRQSARRDAINWTLILALLLLTLVPFHYHLRHDSGAPSDVMSVDNHVADVHVLADDHPVDHHQNSHSIDPAPDITLKHGSAQAPLFAILLGWSILYPLGAGIFRYAQRARSQRLSSFNRHSTPPLRAPPL
jgi:hypothetical protein